MDQDHYCVHNSNPICSYTTYGPLCAPETSQLGTQVYMATYGHFGSTWPQRVVLELRGTAELSSRFGLFIACSECRGRRSRLTATHHDSL